MNKYVIFAYLLLIAAVTASFFLLNSYNASLYILTEFIWLLALFILVCESFNGLNLPDLIKRNLIPVVLISLITAFGLFFRLVSLGDYPKVINGDEGWTGMSALKESGMDNPVNLHPFSFSQGFGRIHLDWFQTSIVIFGRNIFGLRFAQAISGALAIPAIYLFTRFAFGHLAGIGAALFTVFSHVHLHFSRTSAVGYMPGIWLAPLEGLLLIEGLERKNKWLLTLAAVVGGIHFNVYFDGKVFLTVIVIFITVYLFQKRKHFSQYFHLLATSFAIPLFLIILPGLIWLIKYFNIAMERFGMESTFQSGWFELQIQSGRLAHTIILNRILHVFQSIFLLPITNFYEVMEPFLDFISAFLFIIGLIFVIRNFRKPYSNLILFWIITGITAIGIFAIPPESDGYRLLLVFPALAAIIGQAWKIILKIQLLKNFAIMVIILISMINLKIYFIDFVGKCHYMAGFEPDRRWSYIGKFLAGNPYIRYVYLQADEAKHLYGAHPSVDFLSYSKPVNVQNRFIESQDKGWHVFFISPRNEIYLPMYQAKYPNGSLEVITDCNKTTLYVYKVFL